MGGSACGTADLVPPRVRTVHAQRCGCAGRTLLVGTARPGRLLRGPKATTGKFTGKMPEELTARRKDAHLDLAATGDVEPAGNRTLLECVHLVHCAMPELGI